MYGKNLADQEEIVEQHGSKPFFIYRKLSQIKIFILLCENKKFMIEIPSRKEDICLRELSKNCYIKVKKPIKLTAPLQSEYDNEIMLVVFKKLYIIF